MIATAGLRVRARQALKRAGLFVSGDLFGLLADLWRRFGGRFLGLILLMIAVGLSEGIALTVLFVMLGTLGLAEAQSGGTLDSVVDGGLGLLGLEPTIGVVLALFVLAVIVQQAAFLLQSWQVARMMHGYTAMWRHDLMDRILSASWPFLVSEDQQGLVNAVINESNRVSTAVFLVTQLFATAITTVVYLVLAFVTAWEAALALVLFGAIAMVSTRPLVRAGRKVGTEIASANDVLQNRVGGYLSGLKFLKSTATEPVALESSDEPIADLARLGSWSSYHPNVLKAIFEFGAALTAGLVLVVGTQVWNRETTSLLLVLALFLRLYPKFTTVQQNLQQLNISLGAFDFISVLDLRLAAAEERSSDGDLQPTVGEGPVTVELQNVHAYLGDAHILKGVDVTVERGCLIGVAGVSGAGKSTLADTLLGLVAAQGSVTVNGVDLHELPNRTWRQHVGYVAQETFLLNTSIAKNVAWGAAVDEDQIWRALELAHARRFVEALPAALNTPVGDRGARLSGGERQRLGLARALVRQPVLLILDEVTGSLDAMAEASVLDAIGSLRGRVTVLSIAHRLSTLRAADRIYVVEDGRIAESGTWHELLVSRGVLATMWDSQRGE